MYYPHTLYGTIRCATDDSSATLCVLDGEDKLRIFNIVSTGGDVLTIRGFSFYRGRSTRGGGMYTGETP